MLSLPSLPLPSHCPPSPPSPPLLHCRHHCCGHLSQLQSCILCWGWRGGGVLHAVVALWQVSNDGTLCSVLGWCHGGACARQVGGVGVLHSMLRWRHSGACAWWVGGMVGLAYRVGMASRRGLHMASQHHGWILHAVMGWRWQRTCMWRRWRRPWACVW